MALISMTGFGRAEARKGKLAIAVEIKSVNSRFLDLVWRLPANYSQFEIELGGLLKKQLRRGRVEIYVSRREQGKGESALSFNENAFRLYVNTAKQAMKLGGVVGKDAMDVILPLALQQREVLEIAHKEIDTERELIIVKYVLEKALKGLVLMRKREGASLEREIRSLLGQFKSLQKQLKQLTRINSDAVCKRLSERVAKLGLGNGADPQRLAQEVALFADRADVTEELARLDSHLSQFVKLLSESENGRKLEFLLQEMGREVNTVGSKSQNAKASQVVVEAKSILEKLREQILNFE